MRPCAGVFRKPSRGEKVVVPFYEAGVRQGGGGLGEFVAVESEGFARGVFFFLGFRGERRRGRIARRQKVFFVLRSGFSHREILVYVVHMAERIKTIRYQQRGSLAAKKVGAGVELGVKDRLELQGG